MSREAHSGWLTKEGGLRKNWKKRWFSLDSGNKLSYFRTKGDKKAAGTVDMLHCQKIIAQGRCKCVWDPAADSDLCFGIVTRFRTYHVYCDTAEDMMGWMLALKKAARIGLAIPLGNPITPGADEEAYKSMLSKDDTFDARLRTASVHVGAPVSGQRRNEAVPREKRALTSVPSVTRPPRPDSIPRPFVSDEAAGLDGWSLAEKDQAGAANPPAAEDPDDEYSTSDSED